MEVGKAAANIWLLLAVPWNSGSNLSGPNPCFDRCSDLFFANRNGACRVAGAGTGRTGMAVPNVAEGVT